MASRNEVALLAIAGPLIGFLAAIAFRSCPTEGDTVFLSRRGVSRKRLLRMFSARIGESDAFDTYLALPDHVIGSYRDQEWSQVVGSLTGDYVPREERELLIRRYEM